MTAYYNEIDPQAAQWLRNLIAAGVIPAGEVDERSIVDVAPGDLVGFRQCHFFAGVGVWSEALARAGWGDRPVWTGSCPCQPFSDAGAGRGFADERHLWPEWFRLIRECRPGVVFGEQVASKDALAWLDHVQADLEGAGYAVAPLDLCAAGFGAPHIRQRLFFVADAADGDGRRGERGAEAGVGAHGERRGRLAGGGAAGGIVGDAESGGRGEFGDAPLPRRGGYADRAGVVGDAIGSGLEGHGRDGDDGHQPGRLDTRAAGSTTAPGATNGFWADAEWVACRDGKARPAQPGAFPLAHGAPCRVVRLRAYGNAIVAPVAEEFIRAYIDVKTECPARGDLK